MMNYKSEILIVLSILTALTLIAPVKSAFAQDEGESGTNAVAYLDNAADSEGTVTLLFKLNDKGEDSPFFARYHDPFVDDWFYLDNLTFRGWGDDGDYFRLNLNHVWNQNYTVNSQWGIPGKFRSIVNDRRFRYFEIPSTNHAVRRDFDFQFTAYGKNKDAFSFDYGYKNNGAENHVTDSTEESWQSDNMGLGYKMRIANWDGSVKLERRTYDDRLGGANDVNYTTGWLRLGRNIGASDYVEGNVIYRTSEVNRGQNLESIGFGAQARFANVLGIDRTSVTSRVNWINNNGGPSILHPAGDEFTFNLKGQWKPSPILRFGGSYDFKSADVSHGDLYTNFGYYTDPFRLRFPLEKIYQDTVKVNKCNIGGTWTVVKDLDFSAQANWLKRDGIPQTDYVRVGSSTLWWDSENTYNLALRYYPNPGIGFGSGDWLLKYQTSERNNG
ncbi:MAG: hypothetical protein ABIC40_03780, partial [bacterium]